VSVARSTGVNTRPARSSATRGSATAERRYVAIVAALLVATTALSLFDMYLLMSLTAGY
jgi:hypothetical protein